MYLSLGVAISCILLHVSKASDAVLPSTRMTSVMRVDVMRVEKRTASEEVMTSKAKVETFIEPMCRPDTGRFALFPIRNHRMWEMYKKHVASFWTVGLPSYVLQSENY